MSPYLHDCWWRNEPPTTLKEAKPKQEDVSSEAEASPPPAKSDTIQYKSPDEALYVPRCLLQESFRYT